MYFIDNIDLKKEQQRKFDLFMKKLSILKPDQSLSHNVKKVKRIKSTIPDP